MNKFIIGTISNLDRPMNPAAKGSRSLNLYMNRITEEMIRREREQILDAQQEDIRGLATVLEGGIGSRRIVCDRKRGEDRRSEGNVWRDQDTLKYWDEKKKEQR